MNTCSNSVLESCFQRDGTYHWLQLNPCLTSLGTIVSLWESVLCAIKDRGRFHINSSYLEASSLTLLPGSFNRSKSIFVSMSNYHLLNAGNCSSCSGVAVSGIWNLPGCVSANFLSERLAWWQGLGPPNSQLKNLVLEYDFFLTDLCWWCKLWERRGWSAEWSDEFLTTA